MDKEYNLWDYDNSKDCEAIKEKYKIVNSIFLPEKFYINNRDINYFRANVLKNIKCTDNLSDLLISIFIKNKEENVLEKDVTFTKFSGLLLIMQYIQNVLLKEMGKNTIEYNI